MIRHSKTPPNITHRALHSLLRSKYIPEYLFNCWPKKLWVRGCQAIISLQDRSLQGTALVRGWERKDLTLQPCYFPFSPLEERANMTPGISGYVFLLMQTELSLWAHKAVQVLESTRKFSLQSISLQSVWNQTEPASHWRNYNPWKNFTLRLC